jgi:hypothetical protein
MTVSGGPLLQKWMKPSNDVRVAGVTAATDPTARTAIIPTRYARNGLPIDEIFIKRLQRVRGKELRRPGDLEIPLEVIFAFSEEVRTRGFPSPPFGGFGFVVYVY